MQLQSIDWVFILLFFAVTLIIGLWASKRAGKNSDEFFLSGRNMPWWLLGISMVATTFSADTPNLVTDIVRKNGVAGNWVWWAFLLTGMLTVFVYARLWRRSGIKTDLGFYELRYSGKEAAFLRGFRALYLGVIFNVVVMASVMLAAIKIGGVILGLSPEQVVIYTGLVTVIYTSLGGLRGVIMTDFFQFILAMIGTIWAAIVIVNLPEVGGLSNLLGHADVVGKLALFPGKDNPEMLISLLIIPLAVQWWSVWYPGAEPGGGGYVAQRMLAAKDESNALGATLLFNIAHYALRPWPWILIALASLIVFPDMASLQAAFPMMDASKIGDDLAYPAMLTYLPAGLLGLVIASLMGALMSTISTHLNWGASYIMHDFFKRFVDKKSSEKRLVNGGRLATIILMILSALLALKLSHALQAFEIILQIGAGTGLIFILRWFWWRINAWSEITAMVASFVIAIVLKLFVGDAIASHWQLVIGVVLTTVIWVAVTWMTPPTKKEKLMSFCETIRPYPMGWRPILRAMPQQVWKTGNLPLQIGAMFLGCALVYGALFGVGSLLYGNLIQAIIGLLVVATSTYVLVRIWRRLEPNDDGR